VSLASGRAVTDDPESLFGQEYADCLDMAAGATFSINECIGAEIKRHDEKLNKGIVSE
jgi:hypothetical protein